MKWNQNRQTSYLKADKQAILLNRSLFDRGAECMISSYENDYLDWLNEKSQDWLMEWDDQMETKYASRSHLWKTNQEQ